MADLESLYFQGFRGLDRTEGPFFRAIAMIVG